MISGAKIRNKKKTQRIRRQKSQMIASCVTHAKEAHKPDQTDQPSPGTDHLISGPTRQCTREGQWQMVPRGGRPTPPGSQMGSVLAGSLILSSRGRLGIFPCKELAGTDLKHYIRGLPPLSPDTPLEGLSLTLICDLYSLG